MVAGDDPLVRRRRKATQRKFSMVKGMDNMLRVKKKLDC